MQAILKRSSLAVIRWFDSWAGTSNDKNFSPTEAINASIAKARTIDWGRVVPFVALHLSCLFVFVVGFSWAALITAVSLYVIRMFAITA
ncbi:MAG: hypothetical protein AAGG01_24645, partial [Planctomycetota bacterium]